MADVVTLSNYWPVMDCYDLNKNPAMEISLRFMLTAPGYHFAGVFLFFFILLQKQLYIYLFFFRHIDNIVEIHNQINNNNLKKK